MLNSFGKLKRFYSLFFQEKGFNMLELLTAAGIAGGLAVVGIKSYQSQNYKARTTEAKNSLTAVYTAEISFKDTWGTYHENLVIVGAIPEGSYHYDVGFGTTSTLSTTDGTLGAYPSPESIDIRACTNFHQMCEGDCVSSATTVLSALGKGFQKVTKGGGQQNIIVLGNYESYFGSNPSCSVTGGKYVKDYASQGEDYGAGASTFKALARGNLKNEDIWSVDQSKTFQHVLDGTQ